MNELVQKAKNGDKEAFSQLIISIQKDLYKIAKIRLHRETYVEDAVQETVLEAYKCIRKLKNDQYFKTWIIRILINKCNTIYKKDTREEFIEEEIIEEYSDDCKMTDKIENDIDFFLLLNGLNDDEKTAITLYYLYDLTNREISKILHISVGTIKSQISRAKNKIKENLGGFDNARLWK